MYLNKSRPGRPVYGEEKERGNLYKGNVGDLPGKIARVSRKCPILANGEGHNKNWLKLCVCAL